MLTHLTRVVKTGHCIVQQAVVLVGLKPAGRFGEWYL